MEDNQPDNTSTKAVPALASHADGLSLPANQATSVPERFAGILEKFWQNNGDFNRPVSGALYNAQGYFSEPARTATEMIVFWEDWAYEHEDIHRIDPQPRSRVLVSFENGMQITDSGDRFEPSWPRQFADMAGLSQNPTEARDICAYAPCFEKLALIVMARGWRAVSLAETGNEPFNSLFYMAAAYHGLRLVDYRASAVLKEFVSENVSRSSDTSALDIVSQTDKTGQTDKSDPADKLPPRDRMAVRLGDIERQGRKALGMLAAEERTQLADMRASADSQQFDDWRQQYSELDQLRKSRDESIFNPHQKKIMRNAVKYGYDKSGAISSKIDLKDYDNKRRVRFELQRANIKLQNNLKGMAIEKAVLKARYMVLSAPDTTPEYYSIAEIRSIAAEIEQQAVRQARLADEKKKHNRNFRNADTDEKRAEFQKTMNELESLVFSGAHDHLDPPGAASLQMEVSNGMEEVMEGQMRIHKQLLSAEYDGYGEPARPKSSQQKEQRRKERESANPQVAHAMQKRLQGEALTAKTVAPQLQTSASSG